MAEDQEKQSLHRQIEILTIQKETFSKQLDKLRKETALERADVQKKQIKFLDEIRAKDIEIKAVKRFLEKREATLREELQNEFNAFQMEKERVNEVSKELAAKRNLLDTFIQVRKSEFEEKLKTEKALFEKTKNEIRKEIITLNSEISKTRQKILLSAEEHSKEKKALENHVLRLGQEIQDIQSKMEILSNDKNNLAGQMKNSTADLEKLREEMEILKDQSQNDKKILDNSLKKLLKAEKEIEMLAGLKRKNQDLSKQIEILKSEKKSFESESKKITAKINDLQKLIEQRDKEFEKNQQQLNELKNALSEKETELEGIEAQAEVSAQQIKREKEKLTADLHKKEKQIHELENFCDKLKKTNSEVSVENKNLKSTIHSLESEKNKLLEKIAQLQSNLRTQPEKRKPAPEPKKKFKCSECGGINYESDVVCSHCGEKFD